MSTLPERLRDWASEHYEIQQGEHAGLRADCAEAAAEIERLQAAQYAHEASAAQQRRRAANAVAVDGRASHAEGQQANQKAPRKGLQCAPHFGTRSQTRTIATRTPPAAATAAMVRANDRMRSIHTDAL